MERWVAEGHHAGGTCLVFESSDHEVAGQQGVQLALAAGTPAQRGSVPVATTSHTEVEWVCCKLLQACNIS